MKTEYFLTKEQKENLDKFAKRFEIKNLKTFRGMEGSGINSTLYENGKKVCNCDDSGDGGCLDFSEYAVQERLDKEIKKLVGTVKFNKGGMTTEYDAECFVNDLISEALENKEFKSKCKKHTLIITTECGDGQFIMFKNTLFSPETKTFLEMKYRNKLVEIINERFI
jgi:hypothetical protein